MLLANEGDVNKLNTNQESIFDIANNLRNESFVNVMLDHCKQPLELSVTKSFEMILSNLVESENWDLLSQIIDHARVDEISNKYLMALSISVLKKQKTTELFGKIMSLCLDKNIIFCGGETFVTALIKSGIHSSTMVSILARKLFDINKTNLGNETPLVLACEGLLLDVVKILVALNCDLKRYRHEAIESAVLAKLKAKNEKPLKGNTKYMKNSWQKTTYFTCCIHWFIEDNSRTFRSNEIRKLCEHFCIKMNASENERKLSSYLQIQEAMIFRGA